MKEHCIYKGYFATEGGAVVCTYKSPAVHDNGYGYKRIGLGQKQYAQVHRFIWECFNGQIPEGMQINHINGIKDDNRLENLELCTPSENMKHAYQTGLLLRPKGERNSQSKLTNQQVLEIVESLQELETDSMLAKRYGVSRKLIWLIRHKKAWQHITEE